VPVMQTCDAAKKLAVDGGGMLAAFFMAGAQMGGATECAATTANADLIVSHIKHN